MQGTASRCIYFPSQRALQEVMFPEAGTCMIMYTIVQNPNENESTSTLLCPKVDSKHPLSRQIGSRESSFPPPFPRQEFRLLPPIYICAVLVKNSYTNLQTGGPIYNRHVFLKYPQFHHCGCRKCSRPLFWISGSLAPSITHNPAHTCQVKN